MGKVNLFTLANRWCSVGRGGNCRFIGSDHHANLGYL